MPPLMMKEPAEQKTLDASERSTPSGHSHHRDDHDHDHPLNWREINRVLFVAAAATAIWFLGGGSNPYVTAVGVACTLVGGFPIFYEAYENIIQRRMTMELSMAIAIVAALAIREVFTALIITLFVLAAEILEGLTVGRGRRAIQHLINLLPSAATVRRQGVWQEVNIQEISPGDQILVRPGSRIPVDGPVVGGHSFVDQAPITGESAPVEKLAGSVVFAGTINQSGALEVRAERLGRDTTFGKIIEAVERAEQSRAPIQKTADRLSGYLVYFALAAAALTFLFTHNIRSTISVIIVAGACGVAAGTPLAILGAIGQSAREGAIVKGGLYLEALSTVDTVVLDKTGTLTFGNPTVVHIAPANGISSATVLQAAAIAERASEHPLGRSILKRALEEALAIPEPSALQYTPGKGIVATHAGDRIAVGNRALFSDLAISLNGFTPGPAHVTEVLVAQNDRFLGAIRVADTLRPEAVEAIRALRTMGLRTVLLTGDVKPIADAVGQQLGVDLVEAELLPEQKMAHVKDLMDRGRKLAMVGDGINDAPALMQASVGVAMGSGTDVARESAGIALLGNDLLKFVRVVRIAQRCRGIIFFNFAGTIAVDCVGILLAAFGVIHPLGAVFIHVSSELAFILNSARLLPAVARHAA
jgi:heavy metal translocating P-type ATPase